MSALVEHPPQFSFDGADGDFMYFRVMSRTRDEMHDVVLCRRTGVLSCTCEDCTYRKKKFLVGDRYPIGCFHGRFVHALMLPILRSCGVVDHV